MIDEKLYLFNPFQLPKLTDEQIEQEISNIASKFNFEAETLYEVSSNIEIYSNLLYFYGEMLARLTKRHTVAKYLNDEAEQLETHRLRAEWSQTRLEKAPAITYFEALAKQKCEVERLKEFDLLEWKTRFKNAYDSVESKANALKKKMEAFKYEIGVN